MSDKQHEFLKGSLVCIYSQLLPRIREVGKELGYAIAIHGTMSRDFDLLAVPWVDGAASAESLVSMIAQEVGGYVIGDAGGKMSPGEVMPNPTVQPHGRKSWNIVWGGHAFIDLSVMPAASPQHVIISDDDWHLYVCPADKETEAHTALAAITDYWQSSCPEGDEPETPAYLVPVGGAVSRVKFKQFRIE